MQVVHVASGVYLSLLSFLGRIDIEMDHDATEGQRSTGKRIFCIRNSEVKVR
jgi:hypothetical protein